MIKFENLTKDKAKKLLHSHLPESVSEFLEKPYTLSEKQIQYYQENGFVKLESVIEEDKLSIIRQVIQSSVLLRKESDKRTLSEKSKYEQSFLQCGYLCWDFPAMKQIVHSKRLAGIARDLMRVDGIRLWHDQALFKEPNGGATSVHQDSSYWPIAEPQFTTTTWIALNNVTKENGCLYFYPKSHLAKREYVDIFKNPHQPEAAKKYHKEYVPLNPGDATFHSGLTFHGTDANNTNKMREGMTIIYLKDGSTFDASDERNTAHKSCSGLKHGEIIKTEFTPLLTD
ncbi:MAG: phytanoyl-CoA dioxygenase family protein [Ignavibacteriae bacterium]|nr:phytanoyl-CoA dioxygenase family protein [Ignavibacteriota bacterium]NOH00248.1 phytanoyl-CoA dioxygenase family protein [Ignavibacteriota bacterium]